MLIKHNSGKEFYVDGKLSEDLDRIKSLLKFKDRDYMVIVDGEEGEGKSVLSQQIASYIDPSFDLSRMCMSTSEFIATVNAAQKGQAVVFDEAYVGLSSRAAMSRTNKILVNLMMRMRQKNLFVILTLPSIFMLDRYASAWRAKGLFHCYSVDGARGRWTFFNKHNMRILYKVGRDSYSYNFPRTGYFGRFNENYLIDEAAYREKKDKTLVLNDDEELKASKPIFQRNVLFKILTSDMDLTYQQVCELCRKYKYFTSTGRITESLQSLDKKLRIHDDFCHETR